MSVLTKRIRSSAEQIQKDIMRAKKPSLQFPVRSLKNVRYNPKKGSLPWERNGRQGP